MTLEHTRSCPSLTPGDGPCTCGLEFRIQLQTEQTMHAAWRKRAEEAEQSNHAHQLAMREIVKALGRLIGGDQT